MEKFSISFSIFVVSIGLFSSPPLFADDPFPTGNAILCFEDHSIPKRVKEKDPETKQLLHPFLTPKDIEKASEIQFVSVNELEDILLRNPANQLELLAPNENETAPQYIERIAQRFDRVLPILPENILKNLRQFPFERIPWRNRVIAPIDPDFRSSHCVLTSVSLFEKSGNRSRLIWDGLILNQAKELAEQKEDSDFSFFLTLLYFSDLLFFETFQKAQLDRSAAHDLLIELVTTSPSMTARELFEVYLKLGFTGDSRFENPGDLRNFYVWQVIDAAAEDLWNTDQSVYRRYELEVVSEICETIPRLKAPNGKIACPYFGRIRDNGHLHEDLDIRYLLSNYLSYPGITEFKNTADRKKADVLLEKFKDYPKKMESLVRARFKEKWKETIESIPFLDEDSKKRILEWFDENMTGVLPVVKEGEKGKELPLRELEVNLDYLIPGHWDLEGQKWIVQEN